MNTYDEKILELEAVRYQLEQEYAHHVERANASYDPRLKAGHSLAADRIIGQYNGVVNSLQHVLNTAYIEASIAAMEQEF